MGSVDALDNDLDILSDDIATLMTRVYGAFDLTLL
jgi:hypothetical protein